MIYIYWFVTTHILTQFPSGITSMSWHPLHEFVAPVPVTHAVLPEESMTFGNLTASHETGLVQKLGLGLLYNVYIYMYVYIPIYPPWDQRFAPNNGWLGDDPLLSFWDGVLSGRWYVKFQGGFFWFSWRCYPWAVSKNIWTGKNWVATWPGNNIYIYLYRKK